MSKKPFILKLSEHDEKRELEFELEYLRSLTFEERLTLMRQKSRETLKQMVDLGHRKPFEIIKRSSCGECNQQISFTNGGKP